MDVLHPNRYPGSVNAKIKEGWVRIDDELVSDVRHDDVFGAYERDDARCAYLLFYRRILRNCFFFFLFFFFTLDLLRFSTAIHNCNLLHEKKLSSILDHDKSVTPEGKINKIWRD